MILRCELHVKDGKKGSLAVPYWAAGDTGFFETMDVLKKKGYKGWLILENSITCCRCANLNEDGLKL